MNYHFKNNNIYYGDILVAEDMRDATKRLNELEDMLIARDVLNELVKLGYGDFELLIGYDGNLVYTGFTDKVFVIEKDKKILVKE